MTSLRSFAGNALLRILPGALILLGSCDWTPDLPATPPTISVSYQATTATVTATWARPQNAIATWALHYEWANRRVSGGNACEHAEATTQTTATFTCTRSEATAGVMEFSVWAVRTVADSAYPGPVSIAQYEIAPTGVIPPDAVDSLTINVTDASGVHRRLSDEGTEITFEVEENGDTTWRYSPHLADGTILTDLVVQTGAAHDGMQLTALIYSGDEVVGCNGDCSMYPDSLILPGCVEGVDCMDGLGMWPPTQGPVQQANAVFPPLVDVLP